MPNEDLPRFEVVGKIVSLLQGMEEPEQRHVLATVRTWLKLDIAPVTAKFSAPTLPSADSDVENMGTSDFSDRESIDPKQFLFEKEPSTDVERMACLAYYLTHYRNTPHFKTFDLSKINTEAAQRKFANAAYASKNALTLGFLAAATRKGYRQLSSMGEQYVNALPDRDAAREVRRRMSPKRKRKNTKTKSSKKTAK